MLTPEQIEIRKTGIGASEIAACAGISPWSSPIDVWLRKLGIIDEDEAGPEAEVGSELEDSLARIFSNRTGIGPVTLPRKTLRHPDRPWQLASLDVIDGENLADATVSCELKVVGFHMRHEWEDGIPHHVRVQITQQQDVAPWIRDWYCGRLIGTDFRIYRVPHDDALAEEITRIGAHFWDECVLGQTPPPPAATESHLEYLKKLHANGGKTGAILPIPAEHSAHVAGLIERYREAAAALKVAEFTKGKAEAALCALVGDADGIWDTWGRFTWKPQDGAVSWKKVAESLAAEAGLPKVPPAVIEQHRGKPSRRVYDSKSKLWKARKDAERREAA